MEKPADARHPIHDAIKRRFSPYAFTTRIVEPWKLLSMLEAARWAPSSFNEQPWSFIVATHDDPAEHQRIVSCLAEGNIPWAGHVPVLMISVAKLVFEKHQKPNRHAFHDVGLAMGNLVMQATTLGVSVHQMAGFDPEKARELYAIPPTHEAVAAVAIGYAGGGETLPETYRQRDQAPRTRTELASFVFTGRFGASSTLTAGQGRS